MTKHLSQHADSVPVRIEVTETRAVARPAGLPTLVEFAPGHRFPLSTGPNEFSLPAGRYEVQLWSQYALWRVGRAAISIDTTTGPAFFYYAVPYTIYHRGAVGLEPRERPGKSVNTAMTVMVAACLALGLVLVLSAVLLTLLR